MYLLDQGVRDTMKIGKHLLDNLNQTSGFGWGVTKSV